MDGAVYMRYRNLKIGSGPGNDVQLNDIGRCANVSENHAVIFYDDVSLVINIKIVVRERNTTGILWTDGVHLQHGQFTCYVWAV